jgi:hypothetical protein
MSFSPEEIAHDSSLSWSDRSRRAKMLLAASSIERLEVRQSAVEYCRTPPAQDIGREVGPIWQYWAQGEDAAPDLVRACLRSVRRYAGRRDVVFLDEASRSQYATIPDYIVKKRDTNKMTLTHFSNILRLELLSRYGGTWMDATVLLTAPIPDFVEHAPFFVFQRAHDPIVLSTWFMHAVSSHPLVESTKSALLNYWVSNDALADYNMFHHLFEANIVLYPELQRLWNETPYCSAYPTNALQRRLLTSYSEEEFAALLAGFWLYKLTYKFEAKGDFAGTYLEAIINWAGNRAWAEVALP